jgi:hypothetical protein
LQDYFPDPEALSRNGLIPLGRRRCLKEKKMLLPEQEHLFFVEEPEM